MHLIRDLRSYLSVLRSFRVITVNYQAWKWIIFWIYLYMLKIQKGGLVLQCCAYKYSIISGTSYMLRTIEAVTKLLTVKIIIEIHVIFRSGFLLYRSYSNLKFELFISWNSVRFLLRILNTWAVLLCHTVTHVWIWS